MRKEHFDRLNQVTNNTMILEDLCKIYAIKSTEYSMRDMRLGKAVSLISPRPQEDRAIYVIENWYLKVKSQYGGLDK